MDTSSEVKLLSKLPYSRATRSLPFQLLLHRGVGEGATPSSRLLHFTLDIEFIMLSVKLGGIKNHFLSLWYDTISRTIRDHSSHEANEPVVEAKVFRYCIGEDFDQAQKRQREVRNWISFSSSAKHYHKDKYILKRKPIMLQGIVVHVETEIEIFIIYYRNAAKLVQDMNGWERWSTWNCPRG